MYISTALEWWIEKQMRFYKQPLAIYDKYINGNKNIDVHGVPHANQLMSIV